MRWTCRLQSQLTSAVKLCNLDGIAQKQTGDAQDWLLIITYAHQVQSRVDQVPLTFQQVARQREKKNRRAERAELRGLGGPASQPEAVWGGSSMLASSVTVDAMRHHFERFPLSQEEVEAAMSSSERVSVPALLLHG